MSTPVPSAPAQHPAPSALRVEKLGLQIGGATILKDVDVDVAPGSLVGVIGPNGAGKTTLFNVVSGIMTPTAGRVLMNGEDITRMSVPARARAGLGRTFQTSSLFPKLSVLENVRLAAQVAVGRDYSLFHFPSKSGGAKKDAATQRALQNLEEVGLTHKLLTPAGDISHGDKRKLEIAAGEASGHAAHQAAATSELEKRVRVLERIATEQGLGASDLAFQIEALREAREVTAR